MAAGDGSTTESPASRGGPPSALPSVQARALAFLAILVAGICGALIGFAFVRLQCHGNCSTPKGLGALGGGAFAAGGVAVVAVLTLRAMGEWGTIKADRARDAEELLEEQGLGPETRDPPPELRA
jgi:hypothetical protein